MKFIIAWDEKGWFKALGLHHAAMSIGIIAIFHFLGLGDFGAGVALGGYLFRELKENELRDRIEIMDFLSPALISVFYLVFF